MSNCHVLIVEDAPDLRETLYELLTMKGYTCSTAANGRLALERLKIEPFPQIVLLDLMMPVMTGWEVLETLHREQGLPIRPPIVVTSAVADLSELADRYQCPVLQKPVDLGRLLAEVKQACG